MPIYEYACHRCRTIYQFFSKTMGAAGKPKCPKCGSTKLERALSTFAAISPSKSREDRAAKDEAAPPGPEGVPGLEGGPDADDPFARMSPAQQAAAEREMMRLMSDAESMDENDPRQLGHLMERMSQITGMRDKAMDEAIRRLKDGEDPDKIEEDLGEELGPGGDDEGGGMGGMGGYGRDPGLYDF